MHSKYVRLSRQSQFYDPPKALEFSVGMESLPHSCDYFDLPSIELCLKHSFMGISSTTFERWDISDLT